MKPRLRCYVVDDDPTDIALITRLIHERDDLLLVGAEMDEEKALDALLSGAVTVDVLFLDVMMPEINGLHFAEQVKGKTRVVLITGDETKAVQAYEQQVIDYLIKPATRERFTACVDKIKEWFKGKEEEQEYISIQVVKKGEYKRIYLRDISFIESISNYLSLHLIDGSTYVTYFSLSAIEPQLPRLHFQRVHKSFIVSIRHIIKVVGNDIQMPNDYIVKIGPKYQKQFMSVFNAKKLS